MFGILDLGFYFSGSARGPDWQGSNTLLVMQPGVRERGRPLVDALSRADLPPRHLIVATSGSTATDAGVVRLVALSLDAVLASAASVNAHLNASVADVWAHALPLFHVGGLGILARAWLSGSQVVAAIDGKWDARRYHERVTATGATLSALVPSQIYDLVAARLKAPASLRAIVVGGARLEPSLYDGARALGWPCLPSYGMTETSSQVATAKPGHLSDAYPDVLPVLSHAELDVGPEKRIRIRATSLLTGYVVVDHAGGRVRMDDPKRDGWFDTEDLGQLAAGGIVVVGRADETVKVLGELVNLTRVESAIGRWLEEDEDRRLQVADHAVAGVPHPRLGSELVLAVVPSGRPVAGGFGVDGMAEALSRALGGPERPGRVVTVEAIPRTALGKVQRAWLADLVRERTPHR